MIRRPPRSTLSSSSAASDVYKRQVRNSGGVDTLRQLGAEHGFEVLTLLDIGNGGRWSSSRLRGLVTAGDVAGAAEILGRPHRVSGEVVHGDHRGRGLGYPTANLGRESAGLIPADGVYVGRLIRPSLPERDLDGEIVVVEFIQRLRATEKFDTIEGLVEQMADDVERTRTVLSSIIA